jgi:hypothetical protein
MTTTTLSRVAIYEARFGRARPLAQLTPVYRSQAGSVALGNLQPTLSHQKVIAGIMACALVAQQDSVGRLAVVFRPGDVLRAIGHKDGGNRAFLEKLLWDLKHVDFLFWKSGEDPEIDSPIRSSIVEKVNAGRTSLRLDSVNGTATRAVRLPGQDEEQPEQLWRVIFENEFCHLFQLGLGLRYRELLAHVNAIKSPEALAVALFALSQEECNRELVEVFQEIGIPLLKSEERGDAAYQANRRKIRAVLSDGEALLALGITIHESKKNRELTVYRKGELEGLEFLTPRAATSAC